MDWHKQTGSTDAALSVGYILFACFSHLVCLHIEIPSKIARYWYALLTCNVTQLSYFDVEALIYFF